MDKALTTKRLAAAASFTFLGPLCLAAAACGGTQADELLSELRARPNAPLDEGVADRFELGRNGLRPHFSGGVDGRQARVLFPLQANGRVHLEDAETGAAIAFRLTDVRTVGAEAASGYVAYKAAHKTGATVLHRALPTGTEDFLVFDQRPAEAKIAYEVTLGPGIAGLRLVEQTLELLDDGGAPRLRIAPPYLVGSDGSRTEAALAVRGCAFDSDPAAPWGREVTPPGADSCTVEVSWSGEATRYPAILDPRWTTTGSLTVARQDHTAVSLSTGKVLVAGGRSSSTSTTGLATAELYDRTTGTWAATGSMTGGRYMHSATQLGTNSNATTSGKVLVAGGTNAGSSVNTGQLYSPSAGTWTAATNLNVARHGHTATLLASGSVLVAGGLGGTTVLNTAAIYNPSSGSGTWTATGNMPQAVKSHSATLLQISTNGTLNNKVIVVGGNSGTGSVANVQLFDGTSTWSSLAALSSAREGHTATVLSNGNLLIVGGKSGTTVLNTTSVFNVASGSGSWSSAGTLTAARTAHSATLLPSSLAKNGSVLVAAGSNGTSSLSSAELWNGTSTWTATTALASAVQGHTATLLANNMVLIAGGTSGSTTVSGAALYDASFALQCTSNSQCATGFCVSGVCCDTACNGGCGACNLTGKVGTCSPVSSGTVCRASAGSCDVAETCNGTSLTCPSNSFAPSTTVCRAAAGSCDVAEKCTGTSASCPSDGFVAAGTVCRPSAGSCDIAETCPGNAAACPTDRFQPATTVCRASTGSCDAAENCSGTSASCPGDATVADGTTCSGAGACTQTEICLAGACTCPVDPNAVLGFESASDWQGSAAGSVVGLNSNRTEGRTALEVTAQNYVPFTSVKMGALASAGPILLLDILMPTQQSNPSWFGTVQMFVSAPSVGVNNAYLGLEELTGLPVGQWQTLQFQLTSDVVSALRRAANDLTFTIALNVPFDETGHYLFDNLRFAPAITPVLQGIAQASDGTLKAIFTYQNGATTNVHVPYGRANFLSDANGFIASPTDRPPEWFLPSSSARPFIATLTGTTLTWTVTGNSATATTSSPRLPTTPSASGGTDATLPDGTKVSLNGVPVDLAAAIVGTAVQGSGVGGRLSGTFDVTDDGAATYHIPLWVPEGRAGLQPDLALSYSSTQADSVVGYGWRLDGLSTISRCHAILGRDGQTKPIQFNDEDRLCLDGERLALVSGTYNSTGAEYRTEHDQFVKILQTGVDGLGPTGFIAYLANGLIRSYGNDTRTTLAGYHGNATAVLQGNRATVTASDADTNDPTVAYDDPARLSWALASVSDRYANRIDYNYVPIQQNAPDFTIDFRIASITYNAPASGGSGGREIDFDYDQNVFVPSMQRIDIRDSFVGGLPLRLGHILGQITVRGPDPIDPGVMRRYVMSYNNGNRLLLDTIQECDSANTCRPATTFDYTAASTEFDRIPTGVSIGPTTTIIPGDQNGDGKDDLIYETDDGTFNRAIHMGWHYVPSTGSGLGNPVDIIEAANTCDGIFNESNGIWNFLHRDGRVADVNADGRADFIVPRCDPAGLHHDILISDPNGGYRSINSGTNFEATNLPPWANPANGTPSHPTHQEASYAADFDGDGLTDFVRATSPTSFGAVAEWSVRTGALPDQGYSTFLYQVPLSLFETALNDVPVVDEDWNAYVFDFDGDGKSDLLAHRSNLQPNGSGGWRAPLPSTRMQVLRGFGSTATAKTPQQTSLLASTKSLSSSHYFMVDVNGDGLEDAIEVPNPGGNVRIAINTGRDFLPPVVIKLAIPDRVGASFDEDSIGDILVADAGTRVMDYDQDGRSDLFLMDGGCNFAAPNRSTAVVLESRPGPILVSKDLTDLPIGTFTGDGCSGYPTSRVLDVNGDGLSDLVQVEPSTATLRDLNNGGHNEVVFYVRKGQKANLLKTATDGLGHQVNVEYKPITDPSVHTPVQCSYPQYCSPHGNTWVVSRHSYDTSPDNPTGPPLRSFKHSYVGARSDLTGFGWLGMDQHLELDERTVQSVVTTYDHTRTVGAAAGAKNPYVLMGRPTKREVATFLSAKTQGDIKDWVYTYDVHASTDGLRVSVTPQSTTFSEVATIPVFGPPGSPGSVFQQPVRNWKIVTSYNSDFGYLSTRTTTIDGETESEVLTYDADQPGPWLVGQVHRNTATYNTPARPATNTPAEVLTRTTEYHHDPNTGAIAQVIVEPDSTDNDIYEATTYQRNASGQIEVTRERKLDGTERVTTTNYDPISGVYPYLTTNALQQPSYTVYHPGFGVLIASIDPNGLTTSRKYDRLGRVREQDDPNGSVILRTYDVQLGRSRINGMIVDTTANGVRSADFYDLTGRLTTQSTTSEDGGLIFSHSFYDPYGRLTQRVLPYLVDGSTQDVTTRPSVLFGYDELGRKTSMVAGSSSTAWAYDGSTSARFVTTDAGSQSDRSIFDQLGRMVSRVETVGATPSTVAHDVTTRYVYGPFGDLRDVVDTAGNTTHMDYDIRGRRRSLQDPDSGTTTEHVDAFGTLTSRTDGSGRTDTLVPDLLGRITIEDTTEGSNVFTWDSAPNGIGHVGRTTSPDGVAVDVDYYGRGQPGAGQVAAERWSVDNLAPRVDYAYDPAGRLRTLTYPENDPATHSRYAVQYDYNPNSGELQDVVDLTRGSTPLFQVSARFADGLVQQEATGDGVTTTRDFEPVRRLPTSISSTGSSGDLVQLVSYHYDRRGLMDTRNDALANPSGNVTQTYSHDELGRLTQWQGDEGWTVQYTYDDIGNLTQRKATSSAGNDTVTFTPGGGGGGPHALGTMQSAGGTETFHYDLAGRQTQSPDRTVTYTDFDLPRTITTSIATTSFQYDATHRRTVKRTGNATTIYIGSIYELRIASGGTTHVMYVPAEDEVVAQVTQPEGDTPAFDYFHADHLGSVDTVVSQSGVTPMKFDPFGSRISPASLLSSPAPAGRPLSEVTRGFAGMEHDDELGLINMNGRLYDPKTARFLTPDPLVPRPWLSQSFNRYSYAENSPLMRWDPSGFEDEEADPGGDDAGDGGAAGAAEGATEGSNASKSPDASVPTITITINGPDGRPAASEDVPCDSDCGHTPTTVQVTPPASDDQNSGSSTPADSGPPAATPAGPPRITLPGTINLTGSAKNAFGRPNGRIAIPDRVPPPPSDLVPVNKYLQPPGKHDRVFMVHREALRALTALRDAAKDAGFDKEIFSLRSAFRDQGRQDVLHKNAKHPGRGTAKLSEHITGRCFDLYLGLPNDLDLADSGAFEALKSYQWLQENAGSFGLNPYDAEPWHWSYNVVEEGE